VVDSCVPCAMLDTMGVRDFQEMLFEILEKELNM
jgi:hypothetical protein